MYGQLLKSIFVNKDTEKMNERKFRGLIRFAKNCRNTFLI